MLSGIFYNENEIVRLLDYDQFKKVEEEFLYIRQGDVSY
jgi:hypothetical protein